MKMTIRSWALTAVAAALSAALLAACGGNDPDVPGSVEPNGAPTTKGGFTSVISFGDSLSDLGAYAPATSLTGNGAAPYFGGKFTVNSATSTVWVENIAKDLNVVITPAEVGFNKQSAKCPAAQVNAALAGTCTGYGMGGSRVTDPNGIGKAADGNGALTVPMKTQIANHLARFTSFKATDLIFVYGGNNDAFAQFGAFGAKAAQIQADGAAGKLTPDQVKLALFAAQNESLAAMKLAAQELAGYVRDQILAKGGKYVVVMTLPDSTLTPFGSTLSAEAKPVLTAMVDNFNQWLRDGLANQPVKIMDQNGPAKEVYNNPTKFGVSNISLPVCDATKISTITRGAVTDGSSLFCSGTPNVPYNGVRLAPTGADLNTWQFADGVHPTPFGHKLISDTVKAQLLAYGWI
jgi:outer membrane lipase/esterase